MKKKISLLFVLAILISTFSMAYANSDISLSLIEPVVKTVTVGDEINYKVNVKLAKPAKEYKSLFITFEISSGIDYKGASFSDIKYDKESMSISTTVQEQTGFKRYINVNLYNPALLGDKKEFNINISGIVNTEKKEGEKFSNRLVVSYQFEDLRYGSDQVETESKFTFTKNSTTKPVEPEKPVTPPAAVVPPTTDKLEMLMGNSYAEFFTYIQGIADKNAVVEVSLAGNKVVPEIKSDGSFGFMLPSGIKEDIRVLTKDKGGKVLREIDLKYLDMSNITRTDLDASINSIKNFGRADRIASAVNQFNIETGKLELMLGVEGGMRQNIYEFYEELYYLAKDPDPKNVSTHRPFMNGYPEGTFLPGNKITRAEVAAILSRIIYGGEVNIEESTFPDVASGKWYSKYIAHMEREGLMKGYEDGKFLPGNNITRAEFASVISRLKNLTETELFQFKDMDYKHWAVDDIMKVVTAGYMEGYPEGTFGHTNNVTRAEAATTINRALDRNPDKAFIDKNNMKTFKDIKKHWAYYQIIEATTEHDYILEKGKEVYK